MKSKAIVIVSLVVTFLVGYLFGKAESPPLQYDKIAQNSDFLPREIVGDSVRAGEEESPVAYSKAHSRSILAIRESSSLGLDSLIEKIISLYRDLHGIGIPGSEIQIYLDALVALDPLAGIQMYHANPTMFRYITGFYKSWIEQDIGGATEYYLLHSNDKLLGRLLLQSEALVGSSLMVEVEAAFGYGADQIAERLMLSKIDPAEAFELLANDSTQYQSLYSLMPYLAASLAQQDLGYWLGRVQELKERSTRNNFYRYLIAAEAKLNPTELFFQLTEKFPADHPDREAVMGAFVSQAGEMSNEVIIEYARSTADYDLLLSQLSKLAKSNLELALDMFTDIPNSALSFPNVSTFARSVSEGDANLVYDWVTSVSDQYPEIRRAVLRNISQREPDFLREKLETETDAEMIATLVRYVARVEAKIDPVAALATLQSYADVKSYDRTMRNITDTWIEDSPEDYLNYAIDNNEIEGLAVNVSSAAMVWYESKPEAVMDWLSNAAEGDVRDRGYVGVSFSIARNSPREALALTDSISGPRKEEAKIQITARWVSQDKSRLEAILAEVKLKKESEERIRRYVDRM